MASITDCVSEGLKYPFNDVKKILSLGVLFTIINFIVFAILEKTINIFRIIALTDGKNLVFKFSQVHPEYLQLLQYSDYFRIAFADTVKSFSGTHSGTFAGILMTQSI